MNTTLHQGDAWELAKTLPDESINCIVTSPPYFGLRSYLPNEHADKGVEFGTESTPEEYVDNLVALFRELRRALRHDGTLWLNLGSSFCSKQIESEEMILRDDLTPEERRYVLEELAKYAANQS